MYQIKINEKEYGLEFDKNETAEDIIGMLPLKINLQPYSDIEYYGTLPQTPQYDRTAASMKVQSGTLVYCREYDALVIVCRNHQDIFREVAVGKIDGNISWMSGCRDKITAEIKEV